MILTSEILNKLVNSDYIKKVYPMIDRIETKVDWDKDFSLPFYDIYIKIYVNDPDMVDYHTMYERGLDPHYLIDKYIVYLLQYINISTRDISQIYILVIGDDGEVIYG